jgi:8-oxo-dGTP pyrophosphatase MutT (NUDIX family)
MKFCDTGVHMPKMKNPEPQKKIEHYIHTYKFEGLETAPDGSHRVIGSRLYHQGGKGTEARYPHPIVTTLVKDRNGLCILQQRSPKISGPLKFDWSVGGHVNYGQTLEEAVQHEAAEELGAYLKNPKLVSEKPLTYASNPMHLIFVFRSDGLQSRRNPGVEVRRLLHVALESIPDLYNKPFTRPEMRELRGEGYSDSEIKEIEKNGRISNGLEAYLRQVIGLRF